MRGAIYVSKQALKQTGGCLLIACAVLGASLTCFLSLRASPNLWELVLILGVEVFENYLDQRVIKS